MFNSGKACNHEDYKYMENIDQPKMIPIAQHDALLAAKDAEIDKRNAEIEKKDAEIVNLKEEVVDLKAHIKRQDDRINQLSFEVGSLRENANKNPPLRQPDVVGLGLQQEKQQALRQECWPDAKLLALSKNRRTPQNLGIQQVLNFGQVRENKGFILSRTDKPEEE